MMPRCMAPTVHRVARAVSQTTPRMIIIQKIMIQLSPLGLLSHTGSTVPAIAQDGPSSERGRDKHPDELLESSGAASRSPVTEQASDHAQVKVLFNMLSRAGDS